jgi:hypothetical protein
MRFCKIFIIAVLISISYGVMASEDSEYISLTRRAISVLEQKPDSIAKTKMIATMEHQIELVNKGVPKVEREAIFNREMYEATATLAN